MSKRHFNSTREEEKFNRTVKRNAEYSSDYATKMKEKVYNMNINQMRFDKNTKTLYAQKLEYMQLVYVKKVLVHNNKSGNQMLFNYQSYDDGKFTYKSDNDITLILEN